MQELGRIFFTSNLRKSFIIIETDIVQLTKGINGFKY